MTGGPQTPPHKPTPGEGGEGVTVGRRHAGDWPAAVATRRPLRAIVVAIERERGRARLEEQKRERDGAQTLVRLAATRCLHQWA